MEGLFSIPVVIAEGFFAENSKEESDKPEDNNSLENRFSENLDAELENEKNAKIDAFSKIEAVESETEEISNYLNDISLKIESMAKIQAEQNNLVIEKQAGFLREMRTLGEAFDELNASIETIGANAGEYRSQINALATKQNSDFNSTSVKLGFLEKEASAASNAIRALEEDPSLSELSQKIESSRDILDQDLKNDWLVIGNFGIGRRFVDRRFVHGEDKNRKAMKALAEDERISRRKSDEEFLENLKDLTDFFVSSGQKNDPVNYDPFASEPDHSLPFVVFAEIERMSFRVETYGEEDKNKKPLLKALQRLEEKLEEAGYERERLLGAYYIQGKTYQARFVPSKDPEA